MHLCKKCCTFAPESSTPGVRGREMSPSRKAKLLTKHPSRGFQDIFKRRLLTLCSGLMKCRSFELMFQDLATVDVLRDIDYPSCAYLVRLLCICVYARAYLNYVVREHIYIRRGLRVVSSNVSGNARASISGTDKSVVPLFLCMYLKF